ncbi:DUF3034 family protein [Chitinimonas sp.]|uniref:DUF3034 family protein n=1 Tax=Chitinimonas sp. TaxID=1934313 RepID=UPI0035B29550
MHDSFSTCLRPARQLVVSGLLALALPALAESLAGSGKLLLTGGVTQVEGAAGGGLTPWAVIGGYGTGDQIGANAFYTNVNSGDYLFQSAGALLGVYDKVEFSYARQSFNTRDVGTALGLGHGFVFHQDVVGLKVKLAGDAVLEQGDWMPQIAAGIQYKRNDRGAVVRSVGAKDHSGTDFYISATKLLLDQSLLLNATLRASRANQLGILGFGGDKHDRYQALLEGSAAVLLRRDLALGVEFRQKPDNLKVAKEDNWFDAFIAWAPTKHVSVTLAYAHLGNIVLRDKQHAPYLSIQSGF